jgi:hypothetical protein
MFETSKVRLYTKEYSTKEDYNNEHKADTVFG